ncbi:MAG: PEGA domain-containing protein [Myxococcota bacterium]
MRGTVPIAALLGVVVLPLLAAGQEPSPAPEEAATAEEGADNQPENVGAAREAREHFRQGMTHFEARAYREAIHKFQLAAALVPSADLWFNIARAYEELNDESSLRQAIEHYRLYLRDRVDPPDRARVEQRIESLEVRAEEARQARLRQPTHGTLRISANQSGAAVQVGENRLGQTPVPAPINLEPGTHRLELSQEGYVPFRSDVRVAAGVTTAAYADLVPETRYRAVRGRRIFTWILTGLAVAGLATTLGLGIRSRQFQRDDEFDDARDWGRFSDYALGASMILAVGALILYFVEGRAVGTERIEPGDAE